MTADSDPISQEQLDVLHQKVQRQGRQLADIAARLNEVIRRSEEAHAPFRAPSRPALPLAQPIPTST